LRLQVLSLAFCVAAAEAFSPSTFMGGKVQLRQATVSNGKRSPRDNCQALRDHVNLPCAIDLHLNPT
jgi:hypothetical protein